MDTRKVLLVAESFALINRINNDPACWASERIGFNLRVLERFKRRYDNLTDEERRLYDFCYEKAQGMGHESLVE
jgi:hypothetical protein